MRKIFFASIILCLLVAASCRKTNINSGPGGWWTFNSNTYQAQSCKVDSVNFTMSASNTVTGSTYSNIVVYFYDSLPDTGAYTIVTPFNMSAGNQASITLAYQASSATTYYGSIIEDNPTTQQPIGQKIKVTKANGKLAVSGAGIYISTTTSPFDTIPLSFDLTQTQ
jgi:hypothetical protein